MMVSLVGLLGAHVGLTAVNTFLATRWPKALTVLTALLSGASLWKVLGGQESLGKAAKVLGVLTFGLGPISAFAFVSHETQNRYSFLFSQYVNLAVIGNVAGMAFVRGEGTLRGYISPLLCFTLTSWLIVEASKVEWKTVEYHQSIFTYKASPLSWVLHHACYRACLLTLPPFESATYILLEPLSLGTMIFLSFYSGRPVRETFGYADTLAVASSATVSALLRSEPRTVLVSDEVLDIIVVPVQALVLLSSIQHIFRSTDDQKASTNNSPAE